MRTFQDMPAEEGLAYGLGLLCRCTLPGKSLAFSCLTKMFEALLAYELPAAVRAYHDAACALLLAGDRRVSGDLWQDHLLGLAVHKNHAFARMAAAGGRDEALLANMREELSVLGELSRLRSEDVARYAKERQQALSSRPRQGKDPLSVVSTAVWAGANTRPLPREEAEAPGAAPPPLAQARFAFTPWRYGEPGLVDSFVADEALEEIYLRLLSAKDWGALTDDLYNFFGSYGSGAFLAHRAFRLEEGKLSPLPEAVAAPLTPTSLYEPERIALMENTIRFMRGDPAQNALLWGGAGTGKTAHVLSLLHELPEVRLILCRPEDKGGILALLPSLAAQPLRFLLLLDDVAPDGKALRALSSALCGGRAQPPNVLLYATAREAGPGPLSLFPLTLSFPYPDLASFNRLVCELLEAEGLRADPQALHAACVDYQVDARERLAFPGAKMLADRYKV